MKLTLILSLVLLSACDPKRREVEKQSAKETIEACKTVGGAPITEVAGYDGNYYPVLKDCKLPCAMNAKPTEKE